MRTLVQERGLAQGRELALERGLVQERGLAQERALVQERLWWSLLLSPVRRSRGMRFPVLGHWCPRRLQRCCLHLRRHRHRRRPELPSML